MQEDFKFGEPSFKNCPSRKSKFLGKLYSFEHCYVQYGSANPEKKLLVMGFLRTRENSILFRPYALCRENKLISIDPLNFYSQALIELF